MAVEHINCRGDVYYLHSGLTKTGKKKYYFSLDASGDLTPSIPRGFEIYENPNGQVFLRKKVPALIAAEEIEAVKAAVAANKDMKYFKVEAKKDAIVVYIADQDTDALADTFQRFSPFPRAQILEHLSRHLHYSPVLRFVLADEKNASSSRSAGAGSAPSTTGWASTT